MSTSFKGISNYGDSLSTQQLESNLISFLDWGFLNIGAFQNVYRANADYYESENLSQYLLTEDGEQLLNFQPSGVIGLTAYAGLPAVLRPVTDPNFVDGTVFEGFRQNWVWESGIDYATQPISISGVYVDNAFMPNGTSGQYAFNINYPAGRVVFSTPITGDPNVSCEYSFKHVRVDLADSPWFQKIQLDSYRVDDPNFALVGSGDWNILSQNRVQLPAIVVDPSSKIKRIPFAVGDYTMIHKQDVEFDIFSETDYDRKQIHDILINQNEVVIKGFDRDILAASGNYPLNPYGYLNPGAQNYKQIVNSGLYQWKTNIQFDSLRSQEVESFPPVYRAKVRGTFSMYLP